MKRLTVAIEVEVDAAEGQTEADVLDTLVWALDTLADLDRPLTTLDASDLDLSAVRVIAVKQQRVATTPQCGETTCTAPATRQTYSDDYDEQDPWNADGFALWCADHAPGGSWPLVLSEPAATR